MPPHMGVGIMLLSFGKVFYQTFASHLMNKTIHFPTLSSRHCLPCAKLGHGSTTWRNTRGY